MDNNIIPSVRVFQRGKSIHKIVHNISLGQVLTSRGGVTSSSLKLLLFLSQRRASLHRDERCAARLEPRCDPTQRLALPAVLLVFPCAEVGLVACSERCECRASVGLDVEHVGFEGVWVDELGGEGEYTSSVAARECPEIYVSVQWALCEACERTHVCIYALW